MSQKLVLMACGSYSPPTYMHLRMFEIAKDYFHSFGLGTVIGGIMSPVHDDYKKKDLVAAHHRVAMLKLALRSSEWVKVSEWETRQAGWTRTRMSLQHHQAVLNDPYTRTPPDWLPDDMLNLNPVDNLNLNNVDNILDTRINRVDRIDEPDNVNGNTDESEITVKLLCGADLLESFATPGLWSDDDVETIVGRHGLVVVSRAGCDPARFVHESDLLYRHRRNITLVTNYVANEVSSTVVRRVVRRGESAKYLTDDGVIDYIHRHRLYGAAERAEYNLLNILSNYEKKSPQDIIMTSPEETSFKSILISIRDKPTIKDETVTIKKRKSNFLMPNQTDSVSPIDAIKPKMAYVDKVPSTYVPGKAVKIISDGKQHAIKDEVSDTCYSLDSYLGGSDYEYTRRVSEGNVGKEVKKRCSASTIRKLKPDDMKKSKSEVSKLCDKMKSIKLKDTKNYKTRSCNDIVKLILTKHGIHVISDTEAIV